MKIDKVNNELEHFGHKQLNLTCSCYDIIKIFGMPKAVGYFGAKSDWSWVIQFDNLETVEIYDYKIGKNYLGEEDGFDLEEITYWSINCWNSQLAKIVHDLITTDDWASFDHIRKKIFCTDNFIEQSEELREEWEECGVHL
jgi:hypothetical protein